MSRSLPRNLSVEEKKKIRDAKISSRKRTTPTKTETRLQQSLPRDLRNLPAEEVRAGQTLRSGQTTRGGGGSSSRSSVPSGPSANEILRREQQRRAAELLKINQEKERRAQEGRRQQNQKKVRIARITSNLKKAVASSIKQDLILFSNIKKGVVNAADFVSGGSFTRNQLNKREAALNKRVEDFNTKFSGRELSGDEFIRAQAQARVLENEIRKVQDSRKKLESSLKNKLRDFLNPNNPDNLSRDIRKNQEKLINKNIKELKEIRKKINEVRGKEGIISNINLKRLQFVEKALVKQLDDVKKGIPPKILAGEFPIIPAGGLAASKTFVALVGRQKRLKSGKIMTDVVFRTNKGDVGIAKAVTASKGKRGATITLGRTSKTAVELLTGRTRARKTRSFIGADVSRVRKSVLKVRNTIDVFLKKRKVAVVNAFKKNLEGLRQFNIGQVGIFRGNKINKLKIDNFVSVSQVLTKKDVSAIIGKTVNSDKRRAYYAGLIKRISSNPTKILSIKGPSGSGSFVKGASAAQKSEFNRALKKVSADISSAVSKASSSGVKGNAAILAVAATNLKNNASLAGPQTTTGTIKKDLSVRGSTKASAATTSTKTSTLTASTTVSASKQNLSQKVNQLQKQVQQLIPKSKVANVQRVAQRLTLAQQQALFQGIIRGSVPPRIVKLLRGIFPFSKSSKKPRKKEKSRKGVFFNVFGLSRKKLIKLNKFPMKEVDALNRGSFKTDNTTARTFVLDQVGEASRIEKSLKKEKGYFSKNKKKFRRSRIVKGKRVRLLFTYIEKKGKALIDTRGEKKGLRLSKKKKVKKKKIVKRGKTTSRKIRRRSR